MTPDEAYKIIMHSKYTVAKVLDSNNRLLFQTELPATSESCVSQLQEYVPILSGYKKVYIQAKKGKDENWTTAPSWQVELTEDSKQAAGIAGTNMTGISPQEYMTTIIGMMKENNAVIMKNMELTMAAKNADPMQYLPLIDRGLAAMGFDVAKISGAPASDTAAKVKLKFSDLDTMTAEQKNDKILELWESAAKVCSADEMISLLALINSEPAKMAKLITALHKNPAYIDMALTFIK